MTLPIILITGNMASGKSTVAQALAERLPKSVHLRGDLFRRAIVNGQAEMTHQLSVEAQRQLHLRYELSVIAARRYAGAGFTVIYQDIIIGATLAEIAAAFPPHLSWPPATWPAAKPATPTALRLMPLTGSCALRRPASATGSTIQT